MPRIVRDSDDENDSDVDAPLSPPKHGDAWNFDRALGSGSIDSLKRINHAAHREFNDSGSNRLNDNAVDVGQAPASPALSQNKRRKTTSDIAIDALKRETEGTKALKTYGQSRMQLTERYVEDTNQVHDFDSQSRTQIATRTDIRSLDAGIIRDEYNQYEPLIFPEVSSTAPMNTLTQQRLLDEVLSPGFLEIAPVESLHGRVNFKSSIPWSDFITSPSLQQSQQDLPETEEDDLLRRASDTKNASRATSTNSSQDTSCDELSLVMNKSPLGRNTSKVPSETKQSSQRESRRRAITQVDDQNFKCTAKGVPPDADTQKPARSNLLRAEAESLRPMVSSKRVHPETPSSNQVSSDDDPICLPKEHYQPRPSRSRSCRLEKDSGIDYSVRPEKAAKARAKRSKTTGATADENQRPSNAISKRPCKIELATIQEQILSGLCTRNEPLLIRSPISEPLPHAQDNLESGMHEMHSTKEAVKSGVQLHIHQERQDISVHTEQTPKGTSSTSIEKSRKTVSETAQPGSIESHDHQSGSSFRVSRERNVDISEGLVQTGFLPMMERGSSSSRNRRKASLVEHGESMTVRTIDAHTKEKERGRGRPRLRPKPTEDDTEALEHSMTCEHAERNDAQDSNVTALDILSPNSSSTHLKAVVEKKGRGEAEIIQSEKLPLYGPSSPQNHIDVETTRTPEKQKQGAGPAHSPLSKGKMPYRVGLSRRTRIAPLLRVVKK